MTTPTESAAAVLGIAPDLPTATPTTPPPGAAPPPSTPDRAGQAWDPLYHEDPPRLNAEGKWAKKRGNAARKAKGLPGTGWAANRPSKPAAPPAEPASDATPATAPVAADPPPTASQPPPESMTTGAAAGALPVHDGIVDAAPDMRPLEAYAGTAAGIVDGTFGVAQITMGKAWELAPVERRSLTDATQRVLHHYQAPVLGPILELILVLIPILSKRRNDPETRSVLSGVLAWWKNRGKTQAAPSADPYRTMPAPGSSAPAVPPAAASGIPSAYLEGPPQNAARPGERRWIP